MAVTSIWPIKGRVDKVINYARNPEKTTEESLRDQAALHTIDGVVEYAADDLKTEKREYVSCIHCTESTAVEDFLSTKRVWDKTDGRLCYHGYQSFQADEVDAATAHRIGVELATELWGDRFEVVIATHCNTGHYAIMKDQKRTKGKMRLSSMLRSGKELRVFAVQDKDLQKFCEAAKQYGILYCVLKDKNPLDGMTEIMAKAEDAAKINHIFERFKLATVDMAEIKTEIEKTKSKTADIPTPERTTAEKAKDEQFVDQLLSPAPTKEVPHTENPTMAQTTKSRPSEPTLPPSVKAAKGTPDTPERPSVREELKTIRSEQRQKAAEMRDEPKKEASKSQQSAQHKAPASKKPKSKTTKER